MDSDFRSAKSSSFSIDTNLESPQELDYAKGVAYGKPVNDVFCLSKSSDSACLGDDNKLSFLAVY